MRTAIAALATAAALGFGAGWLARGDSGEPRETIRYVERSAKVTPTTVVPKAVAMFPERPKPPLEAPAPLGDASSPPLSSPPILTGDLHPLPDPDGAAVGPIVPEMPTALPVADLAADEARVRRIVIGSGGSVVSSADARDSGGKVGRSLVAETIAGGRDRVQSALRKALGDRIVLSEAGSVGGSSPEIRKAEDALAALRKQRDKARIDFLPNAPTLIDLEEATLKAERELAQMRRATSRPRLNILLRPGLGA